MTYEGYRMVFIVGAALAALMLIVSIVLFFVLKIPRVIGDLTGANARKAIEEIRAQNEGSGEKTYKSSAVNKQRGTLTDKISPSGRLKKNQAGSGGAMHTARIGQEDLQKQAQAAVETTLLASETTLLDEPGNETTVLDAGPVNETTVLGQAPAYETVVLDQAPVNETTLLSGTPVFESGNTAQLAPAPAPAPAVQAAPEPGGEFVVEFDITYVHSDVTIP